MHACLTCAKPGYSPSVRGKLNISPSTCKASLGPIAKPKELRFGENLPKTRSGKIMRRLLRSLANGDAITQDTSTLENPAILGQLDQKY